MDIEVLLADRLGEDQVNPAVPRQRLVVGRESGAADAALRNSLARYAGFHQMMLTADGAAIDFYKALGLARAGKTEPMWMYAGSEHQGGGIAMTHHDRPPGQALPAHWNAAQPRE